MEKRAYPKYLKKAVARNGKSKSPRLLPGLKNLIIDIDGVVCEDVPNEEPERMVIAQEIAGSKKQINSWYKLGHIITFFTARTEGQRKITEKWLKDHGFNYHSLIMGKPRGGNYHYIDDKHVRATIFTGKFGKLIFKKNSNNQII
jgi:hypothetical protein